MLAARASATLFPTGGVPPARALLFVGDRASEVAFEVDETLIRRFESDRLELGLRVVLDGVDVTSSLVGAVEISESLESPIRQGSFQLVGRDFLPHRRWSTWTRVPLQIYVTLGPPGLATEQLELDGIVDTASSSGGVTRISFGDKGLLLSSAKVCYTLDPLAGLTRGEILGRVAELAGATFSSPGGAVYSKPVEVAAQELFPFMAEFAEPEGWYLRVRNDGTIETYRADLKPPGLPPDAEWLDRDLLAPLVVSPPDEAPSRILVRGTGAIQVDELGLETTVEVSETREVFAPEVATGYQNGDGSITPLGGTAALVDRVRTRVTRTQIRRGSRLIREVTLEQGWYNPRNALLTTGSSGGLGSGPAEEGYYYVGTYLDPNDQAVAWPFQRFVVLERVETDYFYDDTDGTLLSQRARTYAWHGRRAAVRATSSPTPSVAQIGIGDDGASYLVVAGLWGIEHFGLWHEARATYQYEANTGAATRQSMAERSWLSPRSSVEDVSGMWVNSDGFGMESVIATWRDIKRIDREVTLDAAGRVSLEVDTITEYWAPTGPKGRWDWGQETRGPWLAERFRYHSQTRNSYRTLSPTAYEKFTVERGATKPPETHPGAPPIPGYLGSPWKQLTEPAIEVILDDEGMRGLLGERIVVLQHPYIDTEEEAIAQAWRIMDREFCHEATLVRRLSWARPGDTVLVQDAQSGYVARALVVERRQSMTLAPPRGVAEYRLQQSLATGGR